DSVHAIIASRNAPIVSFFQPFGPGVPFCVLGFAFNCSCSSCQSASNAFMNRRKSASVHTNSAIFVKSTFTVALLSCAREKPKNTGVECTSSYKHLVIKQASREADRRPHIVSFGVLIAVEI